MHEGNKTLRELAGSVDISRPRVWRHKASAVAIPHMSRTENPTASERDHRESTDVKIRTVLWGDDNYMLPCHVLHIVPHSHARRYEEMETVTINRGNNRCTV